MTARSSLSITPTRRDVLQVGGVSLSAGRTPFARASDDSQFTFAGTSVPQGQLQGSARGGARLQEEQVTPTIADLISAYQAAYEIAHSIAENHPEWTAELEEAKRLMNLASGRLYNAIP